MMVVTLVVAPTGPVLAQAAPAAGGGRRQIAAANVDVVVSGVPDRGEVDVEGIEPIPNPSVDSRFYTDLRAGVRYAPLAGRVSTAFGASTALRRYSADDEFRAVGHSVGGGVRWAVGRSTSLASSMSFAYLPSYSLVPGAAPASLVGAAPASLAPGAGTAGTTPEDSLGLLPESALDFSVAQRVAYNSSMSATASHLVSRRLSMDVFLTANRQNFADTLDPDLTSGSVGASSRFRLNRFATLRLGYSRQLGKFAGATGVSRVSVDGLDFGLDYGYGRSRGTSFALTRSTNLTFTTGMAIAGANAARDVALTGSVTLTQQLGPLGIATVGYSRAVQLEAGLTEPSIGNGVTLGGQREITSNLRFQVQAAFRLNNVGLGAEDQGQYIAYSGSARVTHAFAQRGRLYVQYLTHGHAIDAGVETVAAVRRQQPVRQSFQLGMTWALPLITARSERN